MRFVWFDAEGAKEQFGGVRPGFAPGLVASEHIHIAPMVAPNTIEATLSTPAVPRV